MIETLYLLSLIFVLLILKTHPTSVVFVFLVNFLSGFTPFITTFIKYELVIFDNELVFFLLLLFNGSILISHSLFILFRRKIKKHFSFREYKYSHVVFYFLSLFAVLLVYQNISQGIQVVAHGYIAGYKNAGEQTVKATSLFPFALIFYFFLFILYLKKGKWLYIVAMGCIATSYLMYGSRSFILYTSISSVVFLILMKRITYKKFIFVSVFFIPIFIAFGALRESGGGGGEPLFFRMAMEMANIPMIISNLNVLDDLNQSVIVVGLSALPHSLITPLGIEPINSLATEFVTNYDPGWAKAGGGFGFTIIGEIFYRFGYLGLMLVPYCIVMLLHSLEKKFLEGDEFDKVLVLAFYYGMLMWVRGDFIEISRLLTIMLFFYYSKRLVYRNGK
ncbi:oligosaccharide repeat unit polymerase [Shewanella sp. SM103]|uniref:O-antigen polymerase n=1 Tax=Shewanella sp. SM103 TaxID=2912791 RepID=UPI0021D806A0|nr:O-antigen polymerase [Shewanella sp. SM103]MCU8079282.1 oligosaccharide repeat unit polymerase [Shewanella sp. SM103]